MAKGDLGETLDAFVELLVATGRYRSKNEVLREGVRLVQEREAQSQALDAALMSAVRDSDAGLGKASDEVFDRLSAKYRAIANDAA